jgi:hypothetical protein
MIMSFRIEREYKIVELRERGPHHVVGYIGRSKTWVKIKNPNAPGMLSFGIRAHSRG